MPGVSLGDRFRAAREARGLSLSDCSEHVRIRSVYLAAIEEDNWKAIGAAVYVRGFLRTYARFLGLDPEEVVIAFNDEVQPAANAATETASQRPARVERSSQPGSVLIWVAGIVAVLLVAFVAYNALTMRREAPVALASTSPSPLESKAETSASPAAGVPASASPAAGETPSAAPIGGAQTLALVLSAPSWLRVTVDGSVSIEGTFPAGTTKTFHGKSALVRVGNAGGVEIFVDGKNVGKLGKMGDVAERAFTL
jgi:cytoskeleton protein RodZ